MIGNTIIFRYYENDSIDCKAEEETGLVVDAFTNFNGDRIYKVQTYSDFDLDKKKTPCILTFELVC